MAADIEIVTAAGGEWAGIMKPDEKICGVPRVASSAPEIISGIEKF